MAVPWKTKLSLAGQGHFIGRIFTRSSRKSLIDSPHLAKLPPCSLSSRLMALSVRFMASARAWRAWRASAGPVASAAPAPVLVRTSAAAVQSRTIVRIIVVLLSGLPGGPMPA